jgi:hypothetical protein
MRVGTDGQPYTRCESQERLLGASYIEPGKRKILDNECRNTTSKELIDPAGKLPKFRKTRLYKRRGCHS